MQGRIVAKKGWWIGGGALLAAVGIAVIFGCGGGGGTSSGGGSSVKATPYQEADAVMSFYFGQWGLGYLYSDNTIPCAPGSMVISGASCNNCGGVGTESGGGTITMTTCDAGSDFSNTTFSSATISYAWTLTFTGSGCSANGCYSHTVTASNPVNITIEVPQPNGGMINQTISCSFSLTLSEPQSTGPYSFTGTICGQSASGQL
jgi:hypothetical protein